MLVLCVAVFGLFSLASAWSDGLESLTLLRFLTCLGIGGGLPIAIALTSDHAAPGRQGQIVMLMSVGLPMGSTAGGAFAHAVQTQFGWQAIFLAGGILPLLLLPFLLRFLPESRLAAPKRGPVRSGIAMLFQDDFAGRTLILWMVNFFQLFGVFLILLWLPAMLRGQGMTPGDAVLVTTMYPIGSVLGALVGAPLVDRLGVERVTAAQLCLGAAGLVLVGLVPLSFAALCVVIVVAGIGTGGCQHGINAATGALYPSVIRATGAGWALGIGRAGQIAGPLAGGLLLGLGWQAREIFLAAAVPTLLVALGMAALASARRQPVAGASAAE